MRHSVRDQRTRKRSQCPTRMSHAVPDEAKAWAQRRCKAIAHIVLAVWNNGGIDGYDEHGRASRLHAIHERCSLLRVAPKIGLEPGPRSLLQHLFHRDER